MADVRDPTGAFPPIDFPRGVPGRDDRHAPLGTAQWSFDAPAYQPGHFYLGQTFSGQEAGYLDDRHIVTVAGSRAGKGRTCIIPNLHRWPGSCVVLDPKGENASLTAERRMQLPEHRVAVLDPHGVADAPPETHVSFNPLDLIDADDDDAIDLAAAIGYRYDRVTGHGKILVPDEPTASAVREALEGYVACRA